MGDFFLSIAGGERVDSHGTQLFDLILVKLAYGRLALRAPQGAGWSGWRPHNRFDAWQATATIVARVATLNPTSSIPSGTCSAARTPRYSGAALT